MVANLALNRKNPVILAIVLAFSALTVPVLVAAVPPLSDYPNHLSRLWLLSGGASVPPVSGMYHANWDTMTNIGMDLTAVMLTPLVSYDVLGRLFVAAAVFLAPMGGLLLWSVLHGRFHWWQLSFGLLAWNLGLILGFLNFEIGLGLALLAASADPLLVRCGTAISAIGRAALASIILLVHVHDFAFYGALLFGIALGPNLREAVLGRTLPQIGRSVAQIAATLAVPAILFVLLTPSLPGSQGHASVHSVLIEFQDNFFELYTNPSRKLHGFFVGILTYTNWVDAMTLATLVLLTIVSLVFGRLKAHAGMLCLAVILLICYVICPFSLADAYYVDSRFALIAPFVLAVALRPELPPRPAGILASFLLLVSLARTGIIAWIWHERQADVAAVSRVLTHVPPGSALLPLEHHGRNSDGGPPGRYLTAHLTSYGHLPTLAVPWRHAFVPTVFSIRGQQPLQVLPPWNDIAVPSGGFLASVHALDRLDIYTRALDTAPYLKFWRERFDYVLILNADVPDENGPFVPITGMTLIADEGFAQVYQISHVSH